MKFPLAALPVLLLGLACSADPEALPAPGGGSSARPDASSTAPLDAGLQGEPDATLDAGTVDATADPDAEVRPDCSSCPSGTTCFRDTCLDTCGAAELPFTSEDLAPELRPVRHLCVVPGDGLIAATDTTLALARSATDGRRTTVTVSTHPLRPSATPGPTPTCSVVYEHVGTGQPIGLRQRLELSPSGRHVAFGVGSGGAGEGRAYRLTLGSCDNDSWPTEIYGGATLASDQRADTFVLRRAPQSTMGAVVYREETVVMEASNWLTRYDDAYALVAISSGHGSRSIAWVPLDTLQRGPYPIPPRGSDYQQWPDDAPAVTTRGHLIGLGFDADSGRTAFLRYPISGPSPGAPSFVEPTWFAARTTFHAVAAVARTRQLVLAHARGVLVVEE